MISVGEGNDYGHPDADTVTRLQKAGAKVMRTDTQGTLTLTTDGVSLTLTPERGGSPVTVRARGAGDGATTNTPTSGGATTPSSGLLNLNTASAEQLAALPGLGEKTAAAVVAYRAAHGSIPPTSTITTREALGWVTVEGARMLGALDRIGSLAPGKQADLVVIRASDLNMQPVHDAVSSVVFQTSLANIDSVMVAGTWQKRGGQLLAGELSTQLARLRASGEKIVRAMSLSNA